MSSSENPPDPASLTAISSYITENLDSLLLLVNNEGFPLLLLHVFPFFQFSFTSFDAVFTHLPPLAQRMSRRSVQRLFSATIIRLFDSNLEPHQRGELLSRTTADTLIKLFGLSTFMNRYLSFYVDAMIEPWRLPSSKSSHGKKVNPNFIRMESLSLMTLVQSDMLLSTVFEEVGGGGGGGAGGGGGGGGGGGRGRKSDLSFSLALSDGRTFDYDPVGQGYDSDKDDDEEFSDGSGSDTEGLPEASLLAKSGMLSVDGDTEHERFFEGGASNSGPPPPPSPSAPHFVEHGLSEREERGGVDEKQDCNMEFSFLGTSEELTSSTRHVEHSLSKTDPMTQSITSVLSEDSFATATEPYTTSLTSEHLAAYSNLRSMGRQTSHSIGGLATLEGSASEEEDFDNDQQMMLDSASVASVDPETLAINAHISQVAVDCVSWLIRRLGPLLATQHIARPIVDNLHRCFSGLLQFHGKETSAIKCLSAFADHYGEVVVLKYFIPHAENLVSCEIKYCTGFLSLKY